MEYRSKKDFCSKCNKNFKCKAIFEEHNLTKHLGYRAFCPVCGKKYMSVSGVNRHLMVVHNISKRERFNIKLESGSNSVLATAKYSQAAKSVPMSVEQAEFEAAKSFPCMADVLGLKENITFGKHIVAESHIGVGKTVMVSPAYASIEYLSSHPDTCFHCGKADIQIQCQYCIDVWFCSEKCALNKLHQKNCNKMFDRNDCKSVRLVTKIIDTASKSIPVDTFLEFCGGILWKNKKTKDCKPPYSEYGEILQLKGKAEEIHVSIARRVVKCVKRLPQFDSCSTPGYERNLFYLAHRHTTTIDLNTFSEETAVAEGGFCTRFSIHDVLSRINHSCAPNLHHCIDENNITYCIAVRPIEEGNQLFISYLGEMKFTTDNDRKRYLKETWGFNCKCDKCRICFLASNENNELDPSYIYIDTNFGQSNNQNKVKEECIKFLNKYGSTWSNAVEFVTNCFKHIIQNS